MEADVAIVGAGPAGAAAALALAPSRSVVLIDRRAEPEDGIGETLPGAALRLLEALGVRDGFLAAGHGRCHARRSAWGGERPVELDSLADPDGPGWRLNRLRFEADLRAAAAARGAMLLAPARPARLAREDEGWRLELAGGAPAVRARLLIDASGRRSTLLRGFGARRRAEDRLVCAWLHAPLIREAAAITATASEEEGWWYSAPLPGGRRLLAFHTDADLGSARALATAPLLERASRLPFLRDILSDCDLAAAGPVRICAAHGSRLDAAAGDRWLAAGDAACAFDPLSSQGLFNALYTGRAAGLAAARLLDGDGSAAGEHGAAIERIWSAYRFHRAAYYGAERRWAGRPFWARRLGQTEDAAAA